MTTVTATGPVFDGRAARAMDKLETDLTRDVATRGVVEVRQALDSVLQNPTGFYQSRIQVDKKTKDRALVTDGGVVYGPWLAGVSSRNATTQFRGYTHWRRATQQLTRNARRITQSSVTRRVREMNR